MKLTELFIQREIISELIDKRTQEIDIWMRERGEAIYLNDVQFTVIVHKHSSEFFISVSDTSLKDESRKDEIMNTVFRDLFRIRNFEICEITELFNSFSEEKKKMVMDFANALINTWKDK